MNLRGNKKTPSLHYSLQTIPSYPTEKSSKNQDKLKKLEERKQIKSGLNLTILYFKSVT